MNESLSKLALTKSIMVTLLLFMSMAIPIAYFNIEIHSGILMLSLFVFGFLLITVLPMCYIALFFKYKCPKCGAAWAFSHAENKVVDSVTQSKDGVNTKIYRMLSTYACRSCGHTKIKTKVIEENI